MNFLKKIKNLVMGSTDVKIADVQPVFKQPPVPFVLQQPAAPIVRRKPPVIEINRSFNGKVGNIVQTSGFFRAVKNRFGRETARQVIQAFHVMGLPVPSSKTQYMRATSGILLFLDKYGVTLRIEETEGGTYSCQRIKNPWISQPLGSIKAGKAMIEICPGCHVGADPDRKSFLRNQLPHHGYNYWDDQFVNSGRLPVRTPRFPNGIPVVIDRGAVNIPTDSVPKLRAREMADFIQENADVKEASKKLYEPLQKAFTMAWPHTEKLQNFWNLCEKYKQQGKLVVGWQESELKNMGKTKLAKNAGYAYSWLFRCR